MRHPIELHCTLSKLRCTLRATLHPLSYTAPFWATLHPIWATLHPSELSCTLWANLRPSELRCTLLSYAAPFGLQCALLSYAAPYWAMPYSKWATRHPKTYNVPRPSQLRWSLRLNYWYIEKTPRKFHLGKKSSKVYHCLYSSIEQLQVALWTWTYMFLK